MRFAPLLFLLGALALNCASLTPYEAGECGNRVVDVGEDCDVREGENAQCVACRLRCETIACPDGWGCGTDSICRQKTGRLRDAAAAVSSNAFALKAGDFDADGRIDIVGLPPFGSAGGSRVHYFDRDALLATTTALDVPIQIPIVRNLDGLQGDDIGFGVRGLVFGAFGALAGQTDRTFATIIYPSVTFPTTDARFAVINASANLQLPAPASSCAVGLVSVRGNGAGNFLRSVCSGTIGLLDSQIDAPMPIGTDAVEQTPRAGRIFPSESSCGQVVFATRDALYIVSPCTADPTPTWRSTVTPVVVPFPGTLAEPPFIGRLDDEPDAADGVVVRIEGNVGQERVFELDPLSRRFETSRRFGAGSGIPLASGDLDGDGKTDFVLPTGIALTTPAPFVTSDAGAPSNVRNYRQVAARDQLRWSAARIGRFNNDDLPDVLVSFTNSLDVDVMSNVGGGRFTPFTVRSEQIVRGITSGDFDGDRIEDVAFFQSSGELSSGEEVTLTLAFGSAVGSPEAPLTAGKFRYPRSVDALRGDTGTDNLAIAQVEPDGQSTTSLSVLFGNGGRQQISPLFMSNTATTELLWQPASFSAGSFGASNTQGLISIATGFGLEEIDGRIQPTGFQTAAWYAAPAATIVGGLAPFAKVQDLNAIVSVDEDAFSRGARQLRVITAVGDIDVPANGTDELVNLAVLKNEDAVGVVVVHTAANTMEVVARIPQARVEEGDPIELFDADRDGVLDLVYVIRVGGRRMLNIMRGDGKGGFVTTPITSEATDLKDDVRGFARLDAGTTTKIAVITDSQLWLAELGKDGRLVATDTSRVLGASRTGLTAIVSGDINGDGVPDLAVAQSGGIRVIRQEPTTE